MNLVVYEPHGLKEKRLPFIFHFDTISPGFYSDVTEGKTEHKHFKKHCMQNWHENTEFLYVTSGEGMLYKNSEKIKISANSLVVINSFDLHYTETDNTLEYYCLIPDRGYLQQNGLNTSLINFETLIDDSEAIRLFENIITEYGKDEKYREAGIKSAVIEFVLYLARSHTSLKGNEKDSKALHYMRMAIGYINSHISDKITADELAREIGLSKYHFLREFKKITNMTLIEFINGLRCEKARSMLREENIPISEVSALCGFENGSYFNKIFRRETGLSMSEYRKNARKESE